MPELTPQERLANSRRAIVRNMTRDHNTRADSSSPDDEEAEPIRSAPLGTWGVVKHAVRAWWNNHPVSVAVDLARPAVGKYAQEQPFKLLGISAVVGAAAVLVRPWRLVSLGGVLLAALKSSELSGALHSLLVTPRQDFPDPDERNHEDGNEVYRATGKH